MFVRFTFFLTLSFRRHKMNPTSRNTMFMGMAGGVCLTVITGMLMGQNASTPVKSQTDYFVTGEGDAAHLWVREGTALRCVGHGECTAHGDHADHKEGDGHDHGPAPKKP